MDVNKNTIVDCIYRAIDEINDQLPDNRKIAKKPEAVLLGQNTTLDSLQLVTLIVEIEQKIEDELDTTITLADEKAMSQKHSPFRTISTLADYIDMLLNENQVSD